MSVEQCTQHHTQQGMSEVNLEACRGRDREVQTVMLNVDSMPTVAHPAFNEFPFRFPSRGPPKIAVQSNVVLGGMVAQLVDQPLLHRPTVQVEPHYQPAPIFQSAHIPNHGLTHIQVPHPLYAPTAYSGHPAHGHGNFVFPVQSTAMAHPQYACMLGNDKHSKSTVAPRTVVLDSGTKLVLCNSCGIRLKEFKHMCPKCNQIPGKVILRSFQDGEPAHCVQCKDGFTTYQQVLSDKATEHAIPQQGRLVSRARAVRS
eukprot:m.353277 g.353277  ORF g.353277 m.353277 type:complete len:257 (+) comp16720_c0_seq1:698-1468(+)